MRYGATDEEIKLWKDGKIFCKFYGMPISRVYCPKLCLGKWCKRR